MAPGEHRAARGPAGVLLTRAVDGAVPLPDWDTLAVPMLALLALLAHADPGGAPSAPATPGVATPAPPALSPASAAAAARLEDADPRARILAARALADAPPSEGAAALDLLAARLDRESDPAVRRAFTDALARLPLDEARLVEALATSPEPTARAFAAHALGRSRSDAATAALLAAGKDASALVRTEAYRALGASGDRVALDALLKAAVRDPAAGAREEAAAAAEALAGAPTVPPDVTVDLARLRSGSPEDRAAAARRLGESADRRAFEPLLAAAAAPEPAVAQAAIAALGRLGDARAVPALVPLLGTTTGRTRYAVLSSLATLRDESSVDAVAALLRDADPASRQLAVRALGWIGSDDLFAHLEPAWSDPVEEVRIEALQVVSRSSSPTRVAGLQRALRDASPFVRAEAVRIAAEAGVTDRIPSLLQDPDGLVRLAAADALATLRPPGAAEAVRAAATKARDPEERARLTEVAERLEGGGLPMHGGGQ